jgi:RimJ/RimL family protein N-acetyltransferase
MTRALAAPSALRDRTVSLLPVASSVAALMVAASHDPDVTRWTQIPEGLTMLDAGLITAGWSLPSERIARFRVCPDGGPPMGLVSLWFNVDDEPEVGYWLLPEARGRGVATSAVRLVCTWAFEVCELPVLQVTTLPGNAASEAVARNCGFQAAGAVQRDIKGTMRTLRLWTRERDVEDRYARA